MIRLTVVNSIEEIRALLGLADVCVDEKGVRFRVDVLHHDLETVEASRFGGLDFTRESLEEAVDLKRLGRDKKLVTRGGN